MSPLAVEIRLNEDDPDGETLAQLCSHPWLMTLYARLVPEPDNHHNAWLCPYCMATRRGELAEAWERGRVSGHSNAMRQMSDEPDAPTTANPYLDAGQDQP